MSQAATVFGASAPDRLAHLIPKRIFGDQVDIPLEISLWGGRTYRFGGADAFRVVLERPTDGVQTLRSATAS